MIFHEKNFEEKNLAPWDPLRVPRVPILGPARGIFSKLNGLGLKVTPIPVSALENCRPLRGHSVPM